MTSKTWSRVGIPALLLATAFALPVLAQTAAPAADATTTAAAAAAAPTVNKGDVAWMLTSAVLVLMMSVPGLFLFYGGLLRAKNMLSMLMQVGYCVAIVGLIWVLYGYSLAFTGGSPFIGGFSKAFLSGVTGESLAATFSVGVAIPEFVYIAFQMTFAMITPALIFGAFAERTKFTAVVLFVPLWVTFVYFPVAHMVWYWAGPDAIDAAAKAVAAAADGAAKTAAQPPSTACSPTPATSSPSAPSTSPAAPWCTSMPASPPRRLPHGRQAPGLRQGGALAPLADPHHGRRLPAVGRLVRLQRRLQPSRPTPSPASP